MENEFEAQKMIVGNIVKDLRKNKILGFLLNKQDKDNIRTAIIKVGSEITFEVQCDKERKNLNKFRDFIYHAFSLELTNEQLVSLDDPFEVTLIDKETGKTIQTRNIENSAKKSLLQQKTEMIVGKILKDLRNYNIGKDKIIGFLINKQDKNDTRTAIVKVGSKITFEVQCNKERRNVNEFIDFIYHGFSVALTNEQLVSLEDPFKVTLIDKKTGKTIQTIEIEKKVSGVAALKELKDFDAADALCLEGMKRFPQEDGFYIEYGDIAVCQKNWPEAVKRWALMREKYPRDPRGYTNGASALKENREFDAADALILQGLGRFPKEPGLYLEYIENARRQENDWEITRREAFMQRNIPKHPSQS